MILLFHFWLFEYCTVELKKTFVSSLLNTRNSVIADFVHWKTFSFENRFRLSSDLKKNDEIFELLQNIDEKKQNIWGLKTCDTLTKRRWIAIEKKTKKNTFFSEFCECTRLFCVREKAKKLFVTSSISRLITIKSYWVSFNDDSIVNELNLLSMNNSLFALRTSLKIITLFVFTCNVDLTFHVFCNFFYWTKTKSRQMFFVTTNIFTLICWRFAIIWFINLRTNDATLSVFTRDVDIFVFLTIETLFQTTIFVEKLAYTMRIILQ